MGSAYRGAVYLVGAGPGGVDLITLRGYELLSQADVIVHDYLVDQELLRAAKTGAEIVCCADFGKGHAGTDPASQERISRLLIKRARAGKVVVRLKNGDPLIFGRALEELDALKRSRIRFEIVPGVTAAQAAAAFSGISLTDRQSASSVVFVTGHESAGNKKDPIDWESVAGNGTIVLYMAVTTIGKVAQALIMAGRKEKTPVLVVSRASRIDQKVVVSDLKNIAGVVRKEKITAPAVFIIGEVAKQGKKFDWFTKKKRILYTGLLDMKSHIDGVVFHLPLIEIKPLNSYVEFDEHLWEIANFDWVLFTSKYSAQYFFERLKHLGKDTRALFGMKVAAIGGSTAEKLKGFGVTPDLVPADESSRGLLKDFKKKSIKGCKVFYPHSDLSDKILAHGLRELGAKVKDVIAYRNVPVSHLPDLDMGFFNEIFFTSPSGVRQFVKRYGRPPAGVKIKYMGDVTRAEAKRMKLI